MFIIEFCLINTTYQNCLSWEFDISAFGPQQAMLAHNLPNRPKHTQWQTLHVLLVGQQRYDKEAVQILGLTVFVEPELGDIFIIILYC